MRWASLTIQRASPEPLAATEHDRYTAVLLDVPGTGAHLELVETEHAAPPPPHPESLMVPLRVVAVGRGTT